MQDIAIIGFYVLLAFAFVIIWIWMAGRMATVKRRQRVAQYLTSRFRDVTAKISVKYLAHTGAKIAYHQEPKSPFHKLEATILLLDRSNAFAMIYWKIRGRTDQLQIRANLNNLPNLRIELVSLKEKKRLEEHLVDRPRAPQEITIEYLKEQFYIVSYTPEEVISLFNQLKIRKALEQVMPYLTRLSIAGREPHLFLSVILVPEAMPPMETFALTLGKALDSKKKSK